MQTYWTGSPAQGRETVTNFPTVSILRVETAGTTVFMGDFATLTFRELSQCSDHPFIKRMASDLARRYGGFVEDTTLEDTVTLGLSASAVWPAIEFMKRLDECYHGTLHYHMGDILHQLYAQGFAYMDSFGPTPTAPPKLNVHFSRAIIDDFSGMGRVLSNVELEYGEPVILPYRVGERNYEDEQPLLARYCVTPIINPECSLGIQFGLQIFGEQDGQSVDRLVAYEELYDPNHGYGWPLPELDAPRFELHPDVHANGVFSTSPEDNMSTFTERAYCTAEDSVYEDDTELLTDSEVEQIMMQFDESTDYRLIDEDEDELAFAHEYEHLETLYE